MANGILRNVLWQNPEASHLQQLAEEYGTKMQPKPDLCNVHYEPGAICAVHYLNIQSTSTPYCYFYY